MNRLLDFVHFGRALSKSGRWEVFSTAFYMNCVAVLLFACCFAYVFWLVRKKQKVPRYLGLALAVLGELLVSLLMHPTVDLLVSVSDCERTDGKLAMRRFPAVECFRGFHLVCTLVSYLWLLGYLGLILLFSLLHFEPFVNRGYPMSRGSSSCLLRLNLFIVAGIFSEAFDHGSGSSLFSLCLFLAGATFLAADFHLQPPFYSALVSKLWSVAVLVNWWTYLLLFLATLLARESPTVFPYWLLGGLSIAAFVCIRQASSTAALQTHIDEIADAKPLTLHLQSLLELVTGQSAADQERLSGYVQFHKKYCADPSCPLRSSNSTRHNKLELSSYEQYINLKYGAISNFITYQFKRGVQKHPDSLELRILYCFYLTELAKNTQQALDQLAFCLHSPLLSLQGLYTVERLKKIVMQEAMSSQDRLSRDILLSNNNEINKRIKRLLEEVSLKMVEFWGNFLKETPDIRRVMQLCKKIKSLDSELDGLMEQETAKDSLEPDILRQFASFQEIIMMDENRAEKIYQHIKSAKSLKAAQTEYDLVIKKNEELSKFASAIVFISGMKVAARDPGRLLPHRQHQQRSVAAVRLLEDRAHGQEDRDADERHVREPARPLRQQLHLFDERPHDQQRTLRHGQTQKQVPRPRDHLHQSRRRRLHADPPLHGFPQARKDDLEQRLHPHLGLRQHRRHLHGSPDHSRPGAGRSRPGQDHRELGSLS